MSRPNKEFPKVHITATITPEAAKAIDNYRNDQKNWSKIEDKTVIPTLSGVIQESLEANLKRYFPAAPGSESKPINTHESNNDIVS